MKLKEGTGELGQPLQRICVPGVVDRVLRSAQALEDAGKKDHQPDGEDQGAYGGEQVQLIPNPLSGRYVYTRRGIP